MTVNKYLLPILAISLLFVSVGFAKITGYWSASGKGSIDTQNLTSGDDIRGWMTLQDLSDGFSIPLRDLYDLLHLPADLSPSTALKDLETLLPEFEITDVRVAIDAFRDSQLPVETAVPMIEGTLDETRSAEEELIDLENLPTGSDNGDATKTLYEGSESSESQIKGRSTLREVIEQYQISKDDLIACLNLPEDIDLNTQIKDLVEQGMISEIQAVRDAVSELQTY